MGKRLMNYTKQMTNSGISWLRMKKKCHLICTEYGTHFLKDVFGVEIDYKNNTFLNSIEIEVKNSMADLRNDFKNKKKKHDLYAKGLSCPNYMYYIVPESMSERASELLKDQNSSYGVIKFIPEYEKCGDPFHYFAAIKSVSTAPRLTDKQPTFNTVFRMVRRLQNEYLMNKFLVNTRFDQIQSDIEKFSQLMENTDEDESL